MREQKELMPANYERGDLVWFPRPEEGAERFGVVKNQRGMVEVASMTMPGCYWVSPLGSRQLYGPFPTWQLHPITE